ncbi:hypothetical protein ACK8P5_02920 [Paenibacillus sp. EC2-1]|uniref:hypothetical protein n=1 Tax=Paenibacillus sp. EC2-1 TaxID=3388665 RepID=UPI003BEEF4B4
MSPTLADCGQLKAIQPQGYFGQDLKQKVSVPVGIPHHFEAAAVLAVFDEAAERTKRFRTSGSDRLKAFRRKASTGSICLCPRISSLLE